MVADTTGAGDAFVAGFLQVWLRRGAGAETPFLCWRRRYALVIELQHASSSSHDPSSLSVLQHQAPGLLATDATRRERVGEILHVAERLGVELARAVNGEVRFDGATRRSTRPTPRTTARSPRRRLPHDEDDVVAAVEVCRASGAPILGQGAGTSLAGQGCNVAVVFDVSRHMNRILELDPGTTHRSGPTRCRARRPRDAAAEVHGLTFGPDPATHAWCTIGGMVGNNSCGTHALYAGKTVDNVERLTVVTYDGARLDVGAVRRRRASNGSSRRRRRHGSDPCGAEEPARAATTPS